MKVELRMLALVIALLVMHSTPVLARGANESSRARCERALGGVARAWRKVKSSASLAYDRTWTLGVDGLRAARDYVRNFRASRTHVNHHVLIYDDLDWTDPIKLAYFTRRAEWWFEDLLPHIVMGEASRGRCNWRVLNWESQFYRDPREWMDHHLRDRRSPKYLARAYDSSEIKNTVARDFPNFSKDPDLRAVEVLSGPTLLFTEGARLPKAYARFTLLVLRRNIVVGVYPTLELRASASATCSPAKPTPLAIAP